MLRSVLFVLATGCAQNTGIPNFALEDVNPTSPTFGQEVGIADFEGEVSAWYFGVATCPLCRAHVQALDPMVADVNSENPEVPITILGINMRGRESGNTTITDGVDMPWLQDTGQVNIFSQWPPDAIRELKIVGRDGVEVATFDLNTDDPRDEEPYANIREALLNATTLPDETAN